MCSGVPGNMVTWILKKKIHFYQMSSCFVWRSKWRHRRDWLTDHGGQTCISFTSSSHLAFCQISQHCLILYFGVWDGLTWASTVPLAGDLFYLRLWGWVVMFWWSAREPWCAVINHLTSRGSICGCSFILSGCLFVATAAWFLMTPLVISGRP